MIFAVMENEKMDDYISRQAAIDEVRSYYDECDEREESIEERIEQLPSADVQPVRHGRWTYGRDEETGELDHVAWSCSLCGKKYPWQPNYCPHCGARMDGEQDG